MGNTVTRRSFNASLAAAAGATLWQGRPTRAQSAADKVVLALIGAGGRGHMHANFFAGMSNVEVKTVCDVEAQRAAAVAASVKKIGNKPVQQITDMRRIFDDKDINAVIVATPEHWHALATIWACQAGKDVYVEKNISLGIWEGRKMIEAARKYQRIVQAGTQNRSGPYSFSARDYIASGKLGKVVHVKVFNMLGGGAFSTTPDGEAPEGLDWDRWLGPAPARPYNPGRHRGWGMYWDYVGGSLSGDASHQLDLARMVLGDPDHPKSVYCAGGVLAHDDKRETPDMQAITYDYGDFTMTCENTAFPPYMAKSGGDVRFGDKWPHWPQNATRIEIYGTKQFMYLGRHGGGWQVFEANNQLVAQDKGHFPDKWHLPNFIECIRTRQLPNADVETAHLSACLTHLANISHRLGNVQLHFDAKTERFVDNDNANAMLKPHYREPYVVREDV